MLARLQQFTTLSRFAAAFGWLCSWWTRSPAVAVAGFTVALLGYSLVLAAEFWMLRYANQRDPVGSPRWSELGRAWWSETRIVPQVFFWRQPFRSRVVADYLPANGRRGVVFIHGFVCNRGLWTPWLEILRAREHAFVAVSLEPVFGAIDEYAPLIEAAVARVSVATGMAPVLVCHSMGGLAARAWLRINGDEARVHQVVTIGTPHHGTALAQFSPVLNAAQMRRNSPWLRRLAGDESAPGYEKFTCWYSNCDNIVFPASTATLPGARNRCVRGAAHVSLLFNSVVMQTTLGVICAGEDAVKVQKD